MNNSSIQNTRLHILILILAAVLCYANTLKAPFYLDDRTLLTSNASIRDMGNIPSFFAGTVSSEPTVLATLALNYSVGKYKPSGYHMLNIALHALASVLLYLLMIRTSRLMGGHTGPDDSPTVAAAVAALGASLLFATHPLHTEAVNYISARSGLLSTCLYLLGIWLFTKAATPDKRHAIYTTALVLTSLLGMGTTKSFIMFPVILIIYDFCFVSRQDMKAVTKNLGLHLPVAATALYAIYLISLSRYQPVSGGYFMTQLNVTMTYIRMLVLPYGLSLDHDYPAAQALFEWPTIASLTGYIALWAGGIALLKRYPAIAFGILWFAITLLPESGFLPAKLNMSESRTYLPSAGFLAAISIAATGIMQRRGIEIRHLLTAAGIIALLFCGLSISRNAVWNDPLKMWSDVVAKAPSNPRGHYNLGVEYINEEQYAQAIAEMQATVSHDPSNANAYYNLGLMLMNNSPSAAAESFEHVIAIKPDYPNANVYLGNLYLELKQYDKAISAHEQALTLRKDIAGYILLGKLYLYVKSNPDRAISMFEEALAFNPEDYAALSGIALAYEKKGMPDKAKPFRAKIREITPNAPAPSIESMFK